MALRRGNTAARASDRVGGEGDGGAMADCCSLIEFLHAFEHHSRAVDSAVACSSRSRRTGSSSCGSPTAFCDHLPMAVVNAVVLLSVFAALGFLVVPYVKLRI
uniref:Uncharacterized protein n=2 Tax=Oryza TaxID=4527 RepID=A0A0E0GI18_ORYNI